MKITYLNFYNEIIPYCMHACRTSFLDISWRCRIPTILHVKKTDVFSRRMSLPKEPEEFPKYPPPRITKGRRDVVTAFLQRPSDKAILLVQRSIKVSTYQLHWGGVSGGLEGETESCLFRATQEIQEEVGLFPSQFRFVRRGRPLYVDDGPLRFTVHPLLFVLEENSCQIVLNWENLNARFFPINDIRSLLSTVPKLYETVERVVVSERQERALGRLIQDRSHGAAELALWAIDALRGG